jgi:hypothetical protein
VGIERLKPLILSLLFLIAPPLRPQTVAPHIDIAHAPAPLFDDPVWHGASDPFVIWNPLKAQWFMYYTQRRGTLQNPNGVDWVHGSAIGIATSADGIHWSYLGTAKGDHDLSDPLAAKGAGPEPGLTWWAPCFLWQGNVLHMWVVLVDGVYTSWTGKRNILHFTSADGIAWKYVSTAQLSSNRVIDPTVYRLGDLWYMVYKDEAQGSHTFVSQSADLENWTNAHQAGPDGGQEAPFVFHWKGHWWLIVDAGRSLRIYQSGNGIDGWKYSATILEKADGTRPDDGGVGHHPGIVIQKQGAAEQCLVYYFTQQRTRTIMQLAELELDASGTPFCNRNKYADVK